MALIKRLTKGSPLTFAEGDANLDYLFSLASNTGSLVVSGSSTVTGSLSVSGSSNIIGSSTVTGSLSVSGSSGVSGSLSVSGFITLNLINALDDTDAASKSVPVNGLYRNGNFVLIRIS